jgi:UDP-N-acetylmuramoyl-L-alanyl-D-glutamate--2,6-diaminopimelate ligase
VISASTAISVLEALEQSGVRPSRLCADSRHVQTGDVFVALKGARVDGRKFIAQSIAQGAVAVIADADDGFTTPVACGDTPLIAVPELGRLIGEVASHVLDHPSRKLWLAGVTGTNGKTSVSQWIAQSLNQLGERCGVIGTLGNGLPGALVDSLNTTPDAISLQARLAALVDQGARACAMEVSSIGLDQHRVVGAEFDVAILTNLSRDHLDYHGDMGAYARAKEKLFLMPGLSAAIINLDDFFGRELAAKLGGKVPTIGYSLDASLSGASACDQMLIARSLHFHAASLAFDLDGVAFNVPVVGRFNASNLLAVIGALIARGYALGKIASALSHIQAPPGRMESIGGMGEPLVVVDYAHTPDALEKVLCVLREASDSRCGKLVCVFGCGGDRDPGKRPQMGAVAETYADRVVVTSDNPRSENPDSIIADILKGMHRPQLVEPDRGVAISTTISSASSQDVILLAGKGHEPYQEVGGVRHPFSDLASAQLVLATRRQKGELVQEARQ